jgi:type IV pilus biogenesis protein CpaD/CtpE
MNTYNYITIEDKKDLIVERIVNNERALYHSQVALLESSTNSYSEDEINSINITINRCSSNIQALNSILIDLNNGIDQFNQY